jgi:3-deoxy-D-manno-octulosonic-acid transferase
MTALGTAWFAATILAAPALRVMLKVRQLGGKEVAGRLGERRGFDPTPRPPGELIWLHAASVGETVSILPMLPTLAERAAVLLTTSTVTSAQVLAQRLGADISGRVLHRFAPLDVPSWVARFLDHWKPDAAGFVESELWPNLLSACRKRGVPTILINARLSARSFGRWQRAPGLARQVLGGFARIQPRSETDAERLRALGCNQLTTPADLKLAAPPLPVDEAELARLRDLLADRPIWLAASTHPGEELLILDTHRALVPDHPGLLTIIVPRHPERGASIEGDALRSRGDGPPAEGIWIADTLGELGLWYRLAGIAFVGRSLVPPGGGQNPLEPARFACAIATGPRTDNFADHVAMLRDCGGLTLVSNTAELARWVDALLRDPVRRRASGEAAAAVLRRHSDLPRHIAETLLQMLPHSYSAPYARASGRERRTMNALSPRRPAAKLGGGSE